MILDFQQLKEGDCSNNRGERERVFIFLLCGIRMSFALLMTFKFRMYRLLYSHAALFPTAHFVPSPTTIVSPIVEKRME
jgi:hypothetical protein